MLSRAQACVAAQTGVDVSHYSYMVRADDQFIYDVEFHGYNRSTRIPKGFFVHIDKKTNDCRVDPLPRQ